MSEENANTHTNAFVDQMQQVMLELGNTVENDMKDVLKNFSETVEKKLIKDQDVDVLKEQVKTNIFTKFGTEQEDSVCDLIMQQYGKNVIKDDKYHKKQIGEFKVKQNNKVTTVKVFIGGKVDGVMFDNDGERWKIIEIKNRAKRLFNMVVEYEFIQVQVYLMIHEKIGRAHV